MGNIDCSWLGSDQLPTPIRQRAFLKSRIKINSIYKWIQLYHCKNEFIAGYNGFIPTSKK